MDVEFGQDGNVPDLTAPNLATPGGQAPTFFPAYGEWMTTTAPTWEDIAWMRKEWGGQFMLKGVCRVDDAQRAVDAGVTAISVSNHGGNNLDGTPLRSAFPPIADAVGDQVEIVLDGGIRRGTDVVKALALGARAVMLGRAYLWGLAAGGQAGVENVLDIMRGGIDSALLGSRTFVRARSKAGRPGDPGRVSSRTRRLTAARSGRRVAHLSRCRTPGPTRALRPAGATAPGHV